MTAADKIRAAADNGNWFNLREAIAAVVAKAEALQAQGMPARAIGDEILLTLAAPLGVRLAVGKYAQLVDLDEEGR